MRSLVLGQGVVQDWEVMETYWDHAFTNMLGVDTEKCNVIVTVNLFETKVTGDLSGIASLVRLETLDLGGTEVTGDKTLDALKAIQAAPDPTAAGSSI